MIAKTTTPEQTNWIPLMILLPGTFIALLNVSLLNVALPELMVWFQVSAMEVQWLITAFTAAMGIAIPLTGYLISVKGSKTIYCWSLWLFLIGSCMAPFSNSLIWLIVARVIQAVGAGLMGPVSMVIIYRTIPLEIRGVAMGILGLASMAAPAVGPVLGGYILEHLPWQYLFTLNLPVILPGIWLAAKYLPNSHRNDDTDFDFIGFVSLTAALLIILWSFDSWERGLTATAGLLPVGILFLVFFVIYQFKIPNPLLELSLLKNRNFLLGNLVAGVINFGLFAGVILIPLYTQEVLGYTPLQTGLVMGPAALVLALAQPIGGWLLDRLDPRIPVVTGLCLVAISTWYLSKLTVTTDYYYLLQWQLVRGIGLGLSFAVVTAALNALPEDKTAQGTALLNILRQLSGALGTVAITLFLNQSLSKYLVSSQSLTLNQAKALASGSSFLLLCFLTLLALPLTLLLVNPKLASANPGEASLNIQLQINRKEGKV